MLVAVGASRVNVRHSWAPFAGIIALTIAVRLPFFFPAVIDWDESTFILLGQCLLDGHLPYTHLWDVKPPLLFGFFAAAISLVGHSIIGIRAAGAVCVAATGWITYLIVVRTARASAAWFSAALVVVLSSLISSGQATMSEHVMLPALMGAVWLWQAPDRSRRTYFWMGVLVAVATLVRLNIALTAVAFTVLIGIEAVRSRSVRRADAWLAFCAGGLAVVALVSLPFALAGELPLLWRSAVVAPLVRAEIPVPGGPLLDLVRIGFITDETHGVFWLATFAWCAAVAGFLVARNYSLAFIAASVCAGMAVSGTSSQHYFIQIVPFAAVLCAPLLNHHARRVRIAVWMLASAAAVASLGPVATEYRAVASSLRRGEALKGGAAYEIAAYLQRENTERRPVLLLIDHVAHWLTRSEPVTRFATPPSTLSRPHVLRVMGTTPRAELIDIFARAPEFVVIWRETMFLEPADQSWVESVLARDYAAPIDMGDRRLYRRIRSAEGR